MISPPIPSFNPPRDRGEFCGNKSLFGAVYGTKADIQGDKNLETFISGYCAPTHIHSDNEQMEKSKVFLQIIHKYNVSYSTTKINHQQQNPV